MIFKQAQQVLDGSKTQTRRPVKKYGQTLTPNATHTEYSWPFPPTVIENSRVKWMVGNTYAVQPGRGKKSIGRIRITKIRRERLQEISLEDVEAEGVMQMHADIWIKGVYDFAAVWNSLYSKPYRWEDDIEVWVLEFERVKEGK